jgi:hypothetical protein
MQVFSSLNLDSPGLVQLINQVTNKLGYTLILFMLFVVAYRFNTFPPCFHGTANLLRDLPSDLIPRDFRLKLCMHF